MARRGVFVDAIASCFRQMRELAAALDLVAGTVRLCSKNYPLSEVGLNKEQQSYTVVIPWAEQKVEGRHQVALWCARLERMTD